MLKRTFTYENFDGQEVSDDYYFNLTKAELMELELSAYGGLETMIKRLIEEKNSEQIVQLFKKIILMSVGEKSFDGKRFIKNDEIRDGFYQTEAYSMLFCELVSDPDKANEFLRAIIPQSVAAATAAKAADNAAMPALAPAT